MIRPLTLPAPDILAILREIEAKGTGKTQLRRVLKVPPRTAPIRQIDGLWTDGCVLNDVQPINLPYAVGDLLWVQETWQGLSFGDYQPTKSRNCDLRYAATDLLANADKDVRGFTWRPSTQMPKWASRITLKVTDVRVERLQDTSAQGSADEGARLPQHITGKYPDIDPGVEVDNKRLIAIFKREWNTTQGKPRKGRPDTSWDANPWVAAVTFEPVLMNVSEVSG